jgi:hypothetical protein
MSRSGHAFAGAAILACGILMTPGLSATGRMPQKRVGSCFRPPYSTPDISAHHETVPLPAESPLVEAAGFSRDDRRQEIPDHLYIQPFFPMNLLPAGDCRVPGKELAS